MSKMSENKEKKMSKKEIEIDGVRYVRKDSVTNQPTVMTFGGENPLPNVYTGKFVIVRSRNEGINAGTLKAADDTGCILENCRRLWWHKPADVGLSWYEGVAVSGLSSDSKVSCTVSAKVIVEDYSITLCSNDAEKSIMGAEPNAQS